jgi:peptidoglycan/LPS O-acetylase OafA/YrhL
MVTHALAGDLTESRSAPASPVSRSTATHRPPSEIPSLDGIRAFSILFVFLSHTKLSGLVPGGFGVTVFFFLSGYLITTLLRREADTRGRISLKNFYVRRALRILPPMYGAIALGLALTWLRLPPADLTWAGVASQLFFYANYWGIFHAHGGSGLIPGLTSLWSLAVEEHFYLGFPLLYLLLRRTVSSPRGQVRVLGALWLAISSWRCFLMWHDHVFFQRASLATDTRLDSILIGCMLAIHENPAIDGTAWSENTWRSALVLATLALGIAFVLPGVSLRESVRYSIQGLALIPWFVCAIRWPSWGIFRVLNLRPIKFVGVLSYSLYLVHMPVLLAIEHVTHHEIPGQVAALLSSLALAYVFHLALEKPFARLRRRFG